MRFTVTRSVTEATSVRIVVAHFRQENFDDAKLIEAVQNIEDGLIDADYGGGMIKQRIARDGGGKSGGYTLKEISKVLNIHYMTISKVLNRKN
jgi:hypothetical protein